MRANNIEIKTAGSNRRKRGVENDTIEDIVDLEKPFTLVVCYGYFIDLGRRLVVLLGRTSEYLDYLDIQSILRFHVQY